MHSERWSEPTHLDTRLVLDVALRQRDARRRHIADLFLRNVIDCRHLPHNFLEEVEREVVQADVSEAVPDGF